MKGLVIKNTGSWYTVLTDDGLTADCKIKGNFRLRGIRSTNPIAVGDRVEVRDGFIIEIEDRRNYIIRKSINLSKQSHILAANVDQALLVVTVSKPETSTKCRAISAERGDGIEELRPLLEGKITLLSGNSGVGKSTIIWLIDTPGIKGFGTFDMEREELTSYFKEIFEFSKQCRFSDCTHTHEPGCAVLKAVEDHYIAQSRYQSYLSMLEDKDENKYREAY